MTTQIASQADLEKEGEALGKKLGFYIASAPWPDEVKMAWAQLLEEMSVEEIMKFLEIMEYNYLDAMTQDIDDEFRKQATKLREEDDGAKKALDNLFLQIKTRIA